MSKSKEFNEGWWNCLCSFAEELIGANRRAAEQIVERVLDNAGVTEEELNEILDSPDICCVPEPVYELLREMEL